MTTRSANMPWYDGQTLLHILENVHVAADRNYVDFRFPVQQVLRPHLDFRGFAGTVVSGTVRVGEEVVALPSGRTSRVKGIDTWDGELPEAFAGQAVTLTLDDEIDVSRGDMLVRRNNLPQVANGFEAMLCWMDEERLDPRDALPAQAHDPEGEGLRPGHPLPHRRQHPAPGARRRLRPERDRPGRAADRQAHLLRQLPAQPRHRQLHPDRPGQQPHRGRGHDPRADPRRAGRDPHQARRGAPLQQRELGGGVPSAWPTGRRATATRAP